MDNLANVEIVTVMAIYALLAVIAIGCLIEPSIKAQNKLMKRRSKNVYMRRAGDKL